MECAVVGNGTVRATAACGIGHDGARQREGCAGIRDRCVAGAEDQIAGQRAAFECGRAGVVERRAGVTEGALNDSGATRIGDVVRTVVDERVETQNCVSVRIDLNRSATLRPRHQAGA